jgi:hypothetical protein
VVKRIEEFEHARFQSYTIKNTSPLRISDLIPLLAGQYEATLDCYRRYIELIREQQKILPAAASVM